MPKWWPFSRPVVIQMDRIEAPPGSLVLLSAPHQLSGIERAAVRKYLDDLAETSGVKFAVFDGWRWHVSYGGQKPPSHPHRPPPACNRCHACSVTPCACRW